jgi:DNA repair protein RecN (Recombination protein N)
MHGERDAAGLNAERELLLARQTELRTLAVTEAEWRELTCAQSRLAHAERLLEAASIGEAELIEGDSALGSRLAALAQRLRQAMVHDASLTEVVALVDEARIRVDEAGRSLRSYRERLDLDPAELTRVDERLAAIHTVARKYRVTPEGLPALEAETTARLAVLSKSADTDAFAKAEGKALSAYRALAQELGAKRKLAAMELAHRVTAAMTDLAMSGGRFEVALHPVSEAASYGQEAAEFQVATHPKQASGPLSRVASGGELSRLALAVQVVLADVGAVPTLIFDEIDVGIGGAVAATVGRLLRQLGRRRQVLCVTHLPQVAACADGHFRVVKRGRGDSVATSLVRLDLAAKVEELARMLGGHEITAKTRAHAKELLAQQQRPAAPA